MLEPAYVCIGAVLFGGMDESRMDNSKANIRAAGTLGWTPRKLGRMGWMENSGTFFSSSRLHASLTLEPPLGKGESST